MGGGFLKFLLQSCLGHKTRRDFVGNPVSYRIAFGGNHASYIVSVNRLYFSFDSLLQFFQGKVLISNDPPDLIITFK